MSGRYGSRARAPRAARWMELRYAGTCCRCGKALPKGTNAFYDPADRTVCCTDLTCCEAHGLTREEWHGSPMSGRYLPTITGRRLGGEPLVVTRFSSGETMTRNARGRCEDAPCCGCCT